MKQTVGFIGRGNVGSALKEGLDRAGYETRSGGQGNAAEIAGWADVVVLAVPYSAAADVVTSVRDSLAGKTVVDTTNPLGRDGGSAVGPDTSAAEEFQKLVPEARIVKCFNAVFASRMSSGNAKGNQISALFAGDDEEAKSTVRQLAADIGFDPVDAGPLQNARLLEALARLLIHLGYGRNLGNDIGFKLVR